MAAACPHPPTASGGRLLQALHPTARSPHANVTTLAEPAFPNAPRSPTPARTAPAAASWCRSAASPTSRASTSTSHPSCRWAACQWRHQAPHSGSRWTLCSVFTASSSHGAVLGARARLAGGGRRAVCLTLNGCTALEARLAGCSRVLGSPTQLCLHSPSSPRRSPGHLSRARRSSRVCSSDPGGESTRFVPLHADACDCPSPPQLGSSRPAVPQCCRTVHRGGMAFPPSNPLLPTPLNRRHPHAGLQKQRRHLPELQFQVVAGCCLQIWARPARSGLPPPAALLLPP